MYGHLSRLVSQKENTKKERDADSVLDDFIQSYARLAEQSSETDLSIEATKSGSSWLR